MAKFKPMLKRFDKLAYREATKVGSEKVEAFERALLWCKQHVDVNAPTEGGQTPVGAINQKQFLADMVAEFNRAFTEKCKENINLPVAIEKLYYLLDVRISELTGLAEKFYSNTTPVNLVEGKLVANVDKSEYQIWTVSEEENEKLRVTRELIENIKHVESLKFKVYPFDVCRGFSSFIAYDIREQEYVPNF